MSIKFLAVALVAIFSLQKCGSLSTDHVNEIASRESVKDVKKLIEERRKLNNDIINVCLAALEDANRTITGLSEEVNAKIEELRKKADKQGDHVVECVDGAAAKIDPLVEEARRDAKVCVEGVLDHANTIFDNVVNLANILISEIAQMIGDATRCGFLDIACWFNVYTRGTERITTKVNKLRDSPKIDITEASLKLTECIVPIIAKYTVGMAAISAKAAKCLIS